MKNRLFYYPIIRREFGTIEELAQVVNRSIRYCQDRLNGKKTFTHNEKRLIAEYIGADISEVTQ